MSGLVGEFILGGLILLGGVLFGWFFKGQRAQKKEVKKVLTGIDVRKKKQLEAETQDDKALADRLSDRSRRVPTKR